MGVRAIIPQLPTWKWAQLEEIKIEVSTNGGTISTEFSEERLRLINYISRQCVKAREDIFKTQKSFTNENFTNSGLLISHIFFFKFSVCLVQKLEYSGVKQRIVINLISYSQQIEAVVLYVVSSLEQINRVLRNLLCFLRNQ